MKSDEIKILVIDDEKDFRSLMSMWLISEGYSVITAENGETGILSLKENKPHIVFLDLNMPVLNGIETLKKIRSFNKKIPVIIISAYADYERTKAATDLGSSGIFFKDKEFNEGLALLKTVLRKHKLLKN
jgi:DNA-binding response OmpR family regulator